MFSTAASDAAKCMFDSGYKMSPSYFACLNLPVWADLSGAPHLYLEPADFGAVITADPDTLVPKMLQNYVENALALSGPYRAEGLQNPAEAFFWNALAKLGGLEADANGSASVNGVLRPQFLDAGGILKYTGRVNLAGHRDYAGSTYAEAYCILPASDGASEAGIFYGGDSALTLSAVPEGGGGDITEGLDAYPLEQVGAIYDTLDKKYYTGSGASSMRIDFGRMEAQAKRGGDFDFNAILLYYDIWEAGDDGIRATCLHGILFLGAHAPDGNGGYSISPDRKSMQGGGSAGNSLSYKVSFRNSAATGGAFYNAAPPDDQTGLLAYSEAVDALNGVTSKYNAALAAFAAQSADIANLKSMVAQIAKAALFESRLMKVEESLYSGQAVSRISNEDMFAVFSEAKTALASSTVPVNIQLIAGMMLFDAATGTPFVNAPDGTVWDWDAALKIWAKR